MRGLNSQEIRVIRDVDRLGHRYYYAVIRNPNKPEYNARHCVTGSTVSIVKLNCERLLAKWSIGETENKKR